MIPAPVKKLKKPPLQVKKRFPTLGHMEEAGIITENERKIIEGLDEKCIQVSFSPFLLPTIKNVFSLAPKVLDVPCVGRSSGDSSEEGRSDQRPVRLPDDHHRDQQVQIWMRRPSRL